MHTDNYNIIRNAAEKKLQVRAYFQGEYREMCPHIVGTGGNNEERALFCQFGGKSKSKGTITPKTREWRSMPLDALSEITTVSGEWYSLDIRGQRKKNGYFTQIDFEVPCDLKTSSLYF